MRRSQIIILGLLIALLAGIILLPATDLTSADALRRALQVGGAPTIVSYQGQVKVGDLAYDGDGYFKFAVVSADGNTTYWSNDNTSSGGGEPTNAVSLNVDKGLFNVLLGDTSLSNMTELSADVFSDSERYLRVWFSNDGSTFTPLSPDRRIAAVPYALQASEAANADTLDGQDSSAYQARVSDACSVGSAIREVKNDGMVVCEPHDTRPVYARTTLDSAGNVGRGSSITIGADGLGLISYQDETTLSDLKVAHCNDLACTNATTITLNGGGSSSITVGADGLGLISYYDMEQSTLNVAHCDDLVCSSATSYVIDNKNYDGDAGQFNSITIGADGLGLISYWDTGNGELKVAHCDNLACSTASTYTLDSGLGETYTSITIGIDRLGLISYRRDGDLAVAHCSDVACSTADIYTIETADDSGLYTSITTGTDGMGLISYNDNSSPGGVLKVAHCNDLACSSADTYTIDSTPGAGSGGSTTSIAIGTDGLGLISFYNWMDKDLKLAHCNDLACTNATIATVDSAGDVGMSNAITIGTDGLGMISYFDYHDSSNGDLIVTHCSDPYCVPYFRRR